MTTTSSTLSGSAVTLLLILKIVLPSVDIYGDVRFCVELFMIGHVNWATMMLLPILVSTFFHFWAWHFEETDRSTRLSTLPLVFLQLYGQYRAVRVIAVHCGKWPWKAKTATEELRLLERNVALIEPVFEATPQFFVLTFLLGAVIQNPDLTGFLWLFVVKYFLSALASVFGIISVLKYSPCKYLPTTDDWHRGFLSKSCGIAILYYLSMNFGWRWISMQYAWEYYKVYAVNLTDPGNTIFDCGLAVKEHSCTFLWIIISLYILQFGVCCGIPLTASLTQLGLPKTALLIAR